MSSKQERSLEDYRNAVISLKKTYKQLGEKHLTLQENFRKLEQKRIKATVEKNDIIQKTLKAQIMNKKAMQIQAMIRGGFWRATVKALKEKQRKAKNIQITQQERYLRYVQESTESYEFKAAAEKLENHLKMNCGLSLKMLFRAIDKNNQNSILTEDLRTLLKKISSKQQDSLDMSPAIIEKVIGGLDRNQCGYISLEKFKEALISAGLEKPDRSTFKINATSQVIPDEGFYNNENESFVESTNKTPMQIYLESALQRVAEIIDASGLTTQQVFSKLSIVQGEFMLGNRFFSWLEETSAEGMFGLDKDQKKALLIAFNLDHTQFIKKHEFIVKLLPLQRNFAKIAAMSSRPTSKLNLTEKNTNTLNTHNNLLSPPVPASLNVSSATNNNNVNNSKLSQGRFSMNSIIKGENKYEGGSVLDWKNVQSIINRLFAKQPLHLFLEKLLFCYNAEKPSLNIEEVSRLLDSYLTGSDSGNNVSLMEKGSLFRAMDADGNGQLEMNELIDFFTAINKNVQLSLQTFLIMQAKYLEIEKISSIQFFKDIGLDLESLHSTEDIGINLKTFHDSFGDALGLDEESINRLFIEISEAKGQKEKNNKNSDKKINVVSLKNQGMVIPDGTISARELLRIIDGYRSDSLGNVMARQEDKLVQNKLKRLDEFKLALEVQGHMTIQKLWNKADQENKGYLSLFELKNAIKTALPLLSSLSIIRILSSIDLNENGIIDKEEFRLAFLNSESELAQNKKDTAANSKETTPNPSQRNISQKQSMDPDDLLVISRLKDALIHKGLTPLKFFELADSDKSGSISLVEMRVALAEMNIDLGNLIKLMKIFDINKNGFIEFQEFVEIIGNDLVPTTAARGTNKITALVTLNQTEKVIDKRADLDINQRLDEYGPEQENELKEAILSLGRAVKERQAKKEKGKNSDLLVLQEIFKEFDSNSDRQLSRAEFLSGIDSLNVQLCLTERQKVRLAITADKNKDGKIDLNEFISFLQETVEKLEYEERKRRDKEQRGDGKSSILKIGGGFQLDLAGQKEMLKENMENCLCEQLQSLMEENQLSGQFGLDAMQRKAQRLLELALKDTVDTDQKLSISTLKGILIANTFQFKLTINQIDSLLAAFAMQFPDEIEDNRIVSTAQLNQIPIDESMVIQEDIENENEY